MEIWLRLLELLLDCGYRAERERRGEIQHQVFREVGVVRAAGPAVLFWIVCVMDGGWGRCGRYDVVNLAVDHLEHHHRLLSVFEMRRE